MSKFRFTLTYLETGHTKNFRTLMEISEELKVPYHQIRGLCIIDDKLYLHPTMKELSKIYKITKHNTI